jgi:hypothetical protein
MYGDVANANDANDSLFICKLLTTCLDPGLIDELLFYSMSEEIYWLRKLNRRHSGALERITS